MPQITYIQDDGTSHTIDVANGSSVMQGARNNGLPGIDADYGGAYACATCHVYVEVDWIAQLPDRDEMEEDMLDFATDPDPDWSRLSCQIKVTDALDGLVVRMPPYQGNGCAT